MKIKVLSILSVVLCSVINANAFGGQQNEIVTQTKPDFKDVISSLFGLKTTFVGASRNHVNKKLDTVSGGIGGLTGLLGSLGSSGSSSSGGGLGGLLGSLGSSNSGSSSSGSSGSSSGSSGYDYSAPPPPQVEKSYLPPPQQPRPQYGPPPTIQQAVSNGGYDYAPAPQQSYGPPGHQSSSGSSSGLSSFGESTAFEEDSSSHGSSSSSKGHGSSGSGGLGGLGNIFSSVGNIPGQVIGAKKGAVNSVFDIKLRVLEAISKLASGGGSGSHGSKSSSSSDSHSSSSDLSF